MEKAAQTDELKTRVYNLTLNFVRKYQPQLYMQFRGEQEDLAMDFFCQFLTPKSRILGNEETLLDKFDSSITTIEYLLKISVKRKLIDRSRQDSVRTVSIDKLVEDLGDSMLANFNLVESDPIESVDDLEFDQDFVMSTISRYNNLPKRAQEAIRIKYNEVRNVLAPAFVRLLDNVIVVPVPQIKVPQSIEIITPRGLVNGLIDKITDKTICVLFEGQRLLFNKETGIGRGKAFRDMSVSI